MSNNQLPPPEAYNAALQLLHGGHGFFSDIQKLPTAEAVALVIEQEYRQMRLAAVASERRRLALEMVLMFHGGGYWTDDKRLDWTNAAVSILGTGYTQKTSHGLDAHFSFDATTKVLCDCVRAALGGAA